MFLIFLDNRHPNINFMIGKQINHSIPFLDVFISGINKNTSTGPTNCKKITRHHAHLSLCAKSGKTNDEKSRK